MKKTIAIIMLLLLTACGGGGETQDTSTYNSYEFDGDYTLRDHNCSYTPVKKFTSTGNSYYTESGLIIIKDPGETAMSEGDMYSSYVYYDSGFYILESPELGCTGTFVISETEVNDTKDLTGLDCQIWDLFVMCPDEYSYDGICLITYDYTKSD